ncbi:XRE family transcriptional regulator [Salegentibacter sp. BLCTC]|uniref:XRE family transcriptional regulator n=1 Tax=Salegentibacter sp. BLCTC TaxID=2697368 RepID=UPI00187B837D|nr:XRE family transcriptional regulator [Salegentibacter sp. BLCTC]MBE7641119.1 XRE family transcriptional regulator [Salegentibacter sp. BLCTC]
MIQTEKEYKAILYRIEKLLQNPDNIENTDAPDYIELNLLSDLVADYERGEIPLLYYFVSL